MSFYALEIYPGRPMEQISGITHPPGRVHIFHTIEALTEFLSIQPNTRQIDRNTASMLRGLNPLDTLMGAI